MPIEFRCDACNRLLRTGDGTAGRQAKCPDCGAVVTVPDRSVTPSAPQSLGETPFGSGPAEYRPDDETGNPYQSPSGEDRARVHASPSGEIVPTRIDFEDVFSRTWTIFKEQWGACLVGFLVVFAIEVVLRGPIVWMKFVFQHDNETVIVLNLVDIVAGLCLLWVNLGQGLYFLKIARGQPAEVTDLFTGGPYYLRALGAIILVAIMVLVGCFLCIVPGIIVALMFSQFWFLILDRNVGVIDSLSISKDLMVGNKLMLFLIGLVAAVLGSLIVVMTCGVGFLAVRPFMTLLAPVIYLAITGQPTADQLMHRLPTSQSSLPQ